MKINTAELEAMFYKLFADEKCKNIKAMGKVVKTVEECFDNAMYKYGCDNIEGYADED